jgi:tRNA-Thr(GGU) m(6)t(6)A37 methyltransferase TsaA
MHATPHPPYSLQPIGVFRSASRYRLEQPQQGVHNALQPGRVEFYPGCNYEQALQDLDGFDRVWLVFVFHGNVDKKWRPKAAPPQPPPGRKRVGLFASRSPYRPCPIGISCVKLVAVGSLHLDVVESDLLDGTPILDIKPYIPAFDAFPAARAGWTELRAVDEWAVIPEAEFLRRSDWVRERTGLDCLHAATVQLGRNPLDKRRKRVSTVDGQSGMLAYRTWRIVFAIDAEENRVTLRSIKSGYDDLADTSRPDRWGDRGIHRLFERMF